MPIYTCPSSDYSVFCKSTFVINTDRVIVKNWVEVQRKSTQGHNDFPAETSRLVLNKQNSLNIKKRKVHQSSRKEHRNFIPSSITTMASTSEQPWHASFPEPKVTAEVMPKERAAMMLSLRGVASMLIIDVRRTDYEGGTIRDSLNIPAQGFWWNRGMLSVYNPV